MWVCLRMLVIMTVYWGWFAFRGWVLAAAGCFVGMERWIWSINNGFALQSLKWLLIGTFWQPVGSVLWVLQFCADLGNWIVPQLHYCHMLNRLGWHSTPGEQTPCCLKTGQAGKGMLEQHGNCIQHHHKKCSVSVSFSVWHRTERDTWPALYVNHARNPAHPKV